MRKLAVLVVAFAALGPALVGAGESRDIVVENKTGKPITSLYVSPADSDDFEEDVLGAEVLESGHAIKVHFTGFPEGQCHFDILAANDEDVEWLLREVDLCETATVTIRAKHLRTE